jgi:hypothetical protein
MHCFAFLYRKGTLFSTPLGYKFRLSRQAAQLSFIPQGHKFRLSRQAAQLSFIPQGHKFRLSRQAAQLSFKQMFAKKYFSFHKLR